MHRPLVLSVLASLSLGLGPLGAQTPDPTRGAEIFNAQCARCHGIGGTGGEGPALQGREFRTLVDQAGVAKVIREGLGAMPGSWWLDADQIRDIAAYVWSLARVPAEPVPGDPDAGRLVFEERDRCLRCHIVAGRGIGLGPELSDIGARRGAESLRRAVVAPGEELPRGAITPHSNFLVVDITTTDGDRLRGLRVREDAFRIAIRDRDGAYHSFPKSEVAVLDRRPSSSLMPDYARELSETQIEDLVAYLFSLRGS